MAALFSLLCFMVVLSKSQPVCFTGHCEFGTTYVNGQWSPNIIECSNDSDVIEIQKLFPCCMSQMTEVTDEQTRALKRLCNTHKNCNISEITTILTLNCVNCQTFSVHYHCTKESMLPRLCSLVNRTGVSYTDIYGPTMEGLMLDTNYECNCYLHLTQKHITVEAVDIQLNVRYKPVNAPWDILQIVESSANGSKSLWEAKFFQNTTHSRRSITLVRGTFSEVKLALLFNNSLSHSDYDIIIHLFVKGSGKFNLTCDGKKMFPDSTTPTESPTIMMQETDTAAMSECSPCETSNIDNELITTASTASPSDKNIKVPMLTTTGMKQEDPSVDTLSISFFNLSTAALRHVTETPENTENSPIVRTDIAVIVAVVVLLVVMITIAIIVTCICKRKRLHKDKKPEAVEMMNNHSTTTDDRHDVSNMATSDNTFVAVDSVNHNPHSDITLASHEESPTKNNRNTNHLHGNTNGPSGLDDIYGSTQSGMYESNGALPGSHGVTDSNLKVTDMYAQALPASHHPAAYISTESDTNGVIPHKSTCIKDTLDTTKKVKNLKNETLPVNPNTEAYTPSEPHERPGDPPYFLYDDSHKKPLTQENTGTDSSGTSGETVLHPRILDYAPSYMKTKGSSITTLKPLGIKDKLPSLGDSVQNLQAYSYADTRGRFVEGVTPHIRGVGYDVEKPVVHQPVDNKYEPFQSPSDGNQSNYPGSMSNIGAYSYADCGGIRPKPGSKKDVKSVNKTSNEHYESMGDINKPQSLEAKGDISTAEPAPEYEGFAFAQNTKSPMVVNGVELIENEVYSKE